METREWLMEKLDNLEFPAGCGVLGLACATHSIYAYRNAYLPLKIREELANTIARLGVDSLENARKIFNLGPYPYGEVITYIVLGGLLIGDNLLRRYRGEGIVEWAYSQLKRMPQHIDTKPL